MLPCSSAPTIFSTRSIETVERRCSPGCPRGLSDICHLLTSPDWLNTHLDSDNRVLKRRYDADQSRNRSASPAFAMRMAPTVPLLSEMDNPALDCGNQYCMTSAPSPAFGE